jgi:hypothetical protein
MRRSEGYQILCPSEAKKTHRVSGPKEDTQACAGVVEWARTNVSRKTFSVFSTGLGEERSLKSAVSGWLEDDRIV